MEKFINSEEDEEYTLNFLKILSLIMFVVFISKVKSQEIKIKNIKETNDEMIKKNNKINERKKKEINDYKKFLNLTDRPKKLNDPLIEKEKKLILNKYSKNIGFNVKSD